MKRTKITKEIEQKTIDFYLQGNNLVKTGKLLNISWSTVRNIISRNNITIRTYSEGFGLNKEKEEEIINYYKKGNSLKQCSLFFGYCESSIGNILKRNNIKSNNFVIFNSSEKELEVLNLYLNKKSINKIAKKFNCSYFPIKRILNKNNIKVKHEKIIKTAKIKKGNRKLFCNDNFFENIDNKIKAYFLGLMIADGNNRGNCISISLKYTDLHILELFKKEIEFTGKIHYIKEKIIYDKFLRKAQNQLCIYSKKLSGDLIKLGVIPNKTHFTYFPDIPKEFWKDCIRGIFDGDGCIWVSSKNSNLCAFSIVGSKRLMSEIQKIISIECGLNSGKITKSKNSYSFCFSGVKKCKIIYDWLYKDCEDLFLKRKKEKFEIIWNK